MSFSTRAVLWGLPALLVACGSPTAEELIHVTYVPDEVVLLPHDYRSQPATGRFGVRNDEDRTIFVTIHEFSGDHADVLTTRAGEDVPVPPGETLWFDITYTPTTELWANGSFDATLSLDAGAFTFVDEDFHGNAATYRDAHPNRWTHESKSMPIHFTWSCDLDADGVIASECGGDDCDDTHATVLPGATEHCDGFDNDCDGTVDNHAEEARTYVRDADRDGHGTLTGETTQACSIPSGGWTLTADDCDDQRDDVNPNHLELCGDGADNNCDGTKDEGCTVYDTGDTDGAVDGDTDVIVSDTDDTDPPVAPTDSDSDGLNDDDEATLGTDPHDRDTDHDAVPDGVEVHDLHTNPTLADTDGDGVPDGTEAYTAHTDPTVPDTDHDGLSDGDELFVWASNPKVIDTDDDGLSDLIEVTTHHTEPTRGDTDNDGLSDGREVLTVHSDPLDADTDGDGLDDGDEVDVWRCSPVLADTDGDGLSDEQEVLHAHTDPKLVDTDEDGLTDQVEVEDTLTPPTDPDADNDTLSDGDEVSVWSTDPFTPDTDGDGLDDEDEVLVWATNPNKPDTDGDTLTDGEEVHQWGSNPAVVDPDHDGLTDAEEVLYAGSDPFDSDSDNDGLSDGEEVHAVHSNPMLYDTDDDTLSDGDEASRYGTDPNLQDTDGDGIRDDAELNTTHTDPTVTDTDTDGLGDGDELYDLGTDPTSFDTDADGLDDGAEVLVWRTDPNASDTDGDALEDGTEVYDFQCDPLLLDSDLDTIEDGVEVNQLGTSPALADTDGDQLNDGDELEQGLDPLTFDVVTILGNTTLAPGDLVISELMVDPSACADDRGEYLELTNVTSSWINLSGLRFDTLTAFNVTLSMDGEPDFILAPGERARVVRRGTAPCFLGWSGDYKYSNVLLDNAGDRVRLRANTGTIDEVDYRGWSVPAGASLNLSASALDAVSNDDPASWCASTALIEGSTDLGTPGLENAVCP